MFFRKQRFSEHKLFWQKNFFQWGKCWLLVCCAHISLECHQRNSVYFCICIVTSCRQLMEININSPKVVLFKLFKLTILLIFRSISVLSKYKIHFNYMFAIEILTNLKKPFRRYINKRVHLHSFNTCPFKDIYCVRVCVLCRCYADVSFYYGQTTIEPANFTLSIRLTALIKKLMKRKALRKHSLYEKTAASAFPFISLLLKLFISGNEWCHTTDAP